ncbi:MAG: tetratricopeptide repeat protein [Flammeovirgaceae bacterium]
MRLFILFILIVFCNKSLAQDNKKLNQYFSNQNYSLYVSYFESIFKSKDYDNIDPNLVANYIVSLLKSNFNSSDAMLPSRKLKIISDNIEGYIISNNSNTRDELLYEYGKSEFYKNRFKAAVKFLGIINKKNDEINFLLGISEFNNKNFEQSRKYLDLVNDEIYFNRKNFYLGVISYLNDEFDSSLEFFKKSNDDDLENKYLQYLISINFLLKNYEEVILFENRLNLEVENIDYCFFFIAKSYFILEKYDKVVDILSKLESKIDREDEISFMIAYSQYMNGDYELSKSLFKELSYSSLKYSQFSSFYLGMIFLDEKNYNLAKNYFYASYKKEDNSEYTKKSLINYAKSNYELGDYDLSIAVLNKYKKSYPNENFTEVDDLLSENYFMTNNYSRIISYLNSKGNISENDKIKFQYVTYQKGVGEFNRGNFKSSIKYFDLSKKYNLDSEIYIKSSLNKSEALFIGNLYKEAVNELLGIINLNMNVELRKKIFLQLGYSYFNLNEYLNASKYLKNYLDIKDNKLSSKDIDPILRLADSYYASKNFNSSIKYYNTALQNSDINRNYIIYQIGLCYYGLDDFTKSIDYMDKVILNSEKSLDDDAIFRKAQIYFENSEFDKSIINYNLIIDEYKYSEYISYSFLNRATSYFNLKSYDQAEDDYLYVLKNISDEKIQSQAILGMQKIVSFTNNFTQLNSLITEYKNRFPDNDNVLKIQFDNIRNLYFNQKYDDLISYVDEIFSQEEQVFNEYETNYYLAESFFKTKKYENASPVYETLLDSVNSKYFSRSLNRLAQIYLNQKNYNRSLNYFKKLEKNSKNNRERIDSYIGSLTNYYYLKNYDSVHFYSSQINSFDKISFNNRNKINLLSAKSFLDSGDITKGIDKLLTTINLVNDESAAEANYLLAKVFYSQSQKNQALETLYALNENFSNYDYWVGKSYLLIADIFISMNEGFQANATLESLIDNTDIDEIRIKALELKNNIDLNE